jgi:hypothetical protein
VLSAEDANPLGETRPILYGPAFAACYGASGALGLFVALDAGHLAFVARIAVLMSLCLALFLLLGVLIHRRRFELGFEADHAPERRQARDDRERDRERDRFVDQLFAECRSGSTRSAWTTIEQRAGDGAQRLPELEWIYARVAARPDPRLASRVAGELVNALLAALDAGAPAP